jgi:ketosteroid isomerase-like protein
MSQENVEVVLSIHPAPDVDLARLFRDDASWAALAASLASLLTRDFECVTRGFPDGDGDIFAGVEGLRAAWLDWLIPWESYRTEVEEAIDVGDRVVVLVRDFARRARDAHEVALSSAAVWTVRDGSVARIEFCADRATAFKAAGLAG